MTISNSNFFSQSLLLIGGFAIAYNTSVALHELGHTVAVLIDGGQIQEFVLNPFSWSWNLGQNVSNITFTAWGGVTFGLFFSMLPFLLNFIIHSGTYQFLSKITAAYALLFNGVYLVAGTLFDFGDGGELADLGISKELLLILGSIYLISSFIIWINLQYHLGMNKQTSFLQRLGVITIGFAPYLFLIYLYNQIHNAHQILIWGGFALVGILLAFLIAIAGYWGVRGMIQKQPKVIPLNKDWLILVIALLIIIAEFVVFGTPDNPF
ncbi:hypothetical protein [Carboxylicivirga linearis]|uniref:Peptidase M50 domain-containing protein n=1 Tax=Carboxylicivirga linearis TaxID=1628157 RepID=A0ABS5JTI0_9BACT|nr:hypothetical protein [Carboxylicivirga linearis]MBS2098167.1 hypothetical protein [Carboxylicivirga linearis]